MPPWSSGSMTTRRRTLRYANCGHNPPLLLRADGRIERLDSTTTVLGMFEEWECPTAEIEIGPGDVLLLYTDGITEAFSPAGEEFGEARLIETLRACHDRCPKALIDAILGAAREFSQGALADDLTLIAARGR